MKTILRKKYIINIPDYSELSYHDYDEGQWRGFQLSDCRGNTLTEALASASILEIDKDGGTLNEYPLKNANPRLMKYVRFFIKNRSNKCQQI